MWINGIKLIVSESEVCDIGMVTKLDLKWKLRHVIKDSSPNIASLRNFIKMSQIQYKNYKIHQTHSHQKFFLFSFLASIIPYFLFHQTFFHAFLSVLSSQNILLLSFPKIAFLFQSGLSLKRLSSFRKVCFSTIVVLFFNSRIKLSLQMFPF